MHSWAVGNWDIITAQTGEALHGGAFGRHDEYGQFQSSSRIRFTILTTFPTTWRPGATCSNARIPVTKHSIAGTTRRPSRSRRWREANIRHERGAIRPSGICAGQTWSTSMSSSRRTSRFANRKNRISRGVLQHIQPSELWLARGNPDVPGGAAITSTSTNNRQIEFALKYTF